MKSADVDLACSLVVIHGGLSIRDLRAFAAAGRRARQIVASAENYTRTRCGICGGYLWCTCLVCKGDADHSSRRIHLSVRGRYKLECRFVNLCDGCGKQVVVRKLITCRGKRANKEFNPDFTIYCDWDSRCIAAAPNPYFVFERTSAALQVRYPVGIRKGPMATDHVSLVYVSYSTNCSCADSIELCESLPGPLTYPYEGQGWLYY